MVNAIPPFLPSCRSIIPFRLQSRRVQALHRCASTPIKRQNSLPASYYRGGTSRAIIFHQKNLPDNREEWARIFLGIIGSPDPNGRQLDGMGGGISSLSKVCVIGPSEAEGVDVDYTFAAIGVKDNSVDFSSNCGNMTSAVGPWAVDHGLVKGEEDGMATVRMLNTNTGKIIHSTFPVVDGEAAASGEFTIDGVSGTGAMVELSFMNPAGSKTGKLLPTGKVVDHFELKDGTQIKATCIDAGNPCVFVSAEALGVGGDILPDEMETRTELLVALELMRRQAAVRMGICKTEEETPGSIPKIAMVSRCKSHKILNGQILPGRSVDIVLRSLSVGQPHRAVPITVAMALAAAADLENSIPSDIGAWKGKRQNEGHYTIGHPSGKLMLRCEWDKMGGLVACKVYRTARRLMRGEVYWKSETQEDASGSGNGLGARTIAKVTKRAAVFD